MFVSGRPFDPPLFDKLRDIVVSGRRDVGALQEADLVPEGRFAGDYVPVDRPMPERAQARRAWFHATQSALADADSVFVDPGNGLEPDGFRHGSAKAGKSVQIAELLALARPGRCLVVYHHQTRRKGGHLAEIAHWARRLREAGFARADALRARPYSPRVFFILNGSPIVRDRAKRMASVWESLLSWHPDGAADGTRPTPQDQGLDRAGTTS
jgi:hypothetical protein